LVVALAGLIVKVLLTFGFYEYELGNDRHAKHLARILGMRGRELLVVVSLGSMLLMPILDPRQIGSIYIGQIAPNIWHNPTSLYVWPLVIALFFAAGRYLEKPRGALLGVIGGLFVLNVLAKPNFVLAFGPALSIACLLRYGPSRTLLWSQLALLPTLFILVAQAYWAYSHTVPTEATSVVFAPLAAWRMHSTSVPLSIARSVAFPLTYVLLYRRHLRRPRLMALGWLTFGVALLWALLLAESDWRMWHFNFVWGAHLALYPLFIVTVADLCAAPLPRKDVVDRPSATACTVVWTLLGLHFVSGCVYFFRQAIGMGYP
jgi:hypothetical protein